MGHQTSVLVLNGPNLNMLGSREPALYGTETLEAIETLCREHAEALGLSVTFLQSNLEGELVTQIQAARHSHNGIVINAAAYTHTSIAIRDALVLADIPVIEVHLSNVFKRERFRHHSYISPVAHGVICGLGAQGYLLALEALAQIIHPT